MVVVVEVRMPLWWPVGYGGSRWRLMLALSTPDQESIAGASRRVPYVTLDTSADEIAEVTCVSGRRCSPRASTDPR